MRNIFIVLYVIFVACSPAFCESISKTYTAETSMTFQLTMTPFGHYCAPKVVAGGTTTYQGKTISGGRTEYSVSPDFYPFVNGQPAVENAVLKAEISYFTEDGKEHFETANTSFVRKIKTSDGDYVCTYSMTYTLNFTGDGDECTCGACCSCECTCGNWDGDTCGGTENDCDCHDEDCTCGACCSCKCTCGNWDGDTCGGTKDDCDCHDENCTCGACCYCKCTCGKWPQDNKCVGSCSHDCKGSDCNCGERDGMTWVHCECHHDGHGDCCEHHYKDFKGGEHVPPTDSQKPGMPNMGGHAASDPDFSIPSAPGTPNQTPVDKPPTPNIMAPQEKQYQWEYFEREEGEWPSFKYEEVFEDMKDKLKEKLPLDFMDKMSGGGGGGGGARPDFSFRIRFSFQNNNYEFPKIDLWDYIDWYSGQEYSNKIRNAILFFVSIYSVVSIIGVLFNAK